MKTVAKNVDVKLDLNTVKFALDKTWPIKSNSVHECVSVNQFNMLSSASRGTFMDELCRVLKVAGKATVITPYYSSMRSIADYSTQWPPVCEMSFLYFNKEWRTANKVHPELKCDFDFTYGYQCDPETSTRAQDVQSYWLKHFNNTALDLHINLVRRS